MFPVSALLRNPLFNNDAVANIFGEYGVFPSVLFVPVLIALRLLRCSTALGIASILVGLIGCTLPIALFMLSPGGFLVLFPWPSAAVLILSWILLACRV
jgi:hypothetical protein